MSMTATKTMEQKALLAAAPSMNFNATSRPNYQAGWQWMQQPGPVILIIAKYGVGTGGGLPSQAAIMAYTPPVQAPLGQGISLDHGLTPARILTVVRESFGLNIKQAAQVFKVERPTIYLWASQEDFTRVRPQNRERMRALYALARQWQHRGRLPNSALTLAFDGGPTLIDMLSATEVHAAGVMARHEALKVQLPQLEAQQGVRAMALGHALGDAFKAMDKVAAKEGAQS
jgi:hypothetical protein